MDEPLDITEWLQARLPGRVEEVLVQGDRPLLLDDPSCAYVTLSDQHPLFCVGYAQGLPVGRREHLAMCGPGQLLFGLQPPASTDATALLLSGVTGSRLLRLPMAALMSLSHDDEGRAVLAQLFDRWIGLLISALPQKQLPTRAWSVAPQEVVETEADIPLHAEAGIAWLAPRAQPSSFQGLAVEQYGVRPDCWPVSETGWAQFPAESLRVWSTEELLLASADGGFAAGFYAFCVAVISARRGEVATTRLARDATSRWVEQEFVTTALASLSQLGEGTQQRFQGDLHRRGGDPFSRACDRIFHFLGLHPLPQVRSPRGHALEDMQAALNRLTGVRTRAVLLEDGFERDDCGPILAFVADDERMVQPVALLPQGGAYQIYDPHGERLEPLTPAELSRLHPRAHQFYPALPTRALGPLDIVRFAARRARGDLARVMAIGLFTGALGTLLPLLTGQIFDRIIPGAERGLLWQLILVLFAVNVASWFFDVASGFALVSAQTRMDATLEAGVWDRLLSLPLPFFRKYSAGDLAERAAGIGAIQDQLSQVGMSAILSGLFSVWNLVLLFYYDLRLALAASVLVAIAATVAIGVSFIELSIGRRLIEIDGRISGLLLQLLGGVAKLRVAGAENRAFGVWARLFARRSQVELRSHRIDNRVDVFQTIYPVVCTGTLYFLMAGPEAQAMSTGKFLAFSAAFSTFMDALLGLVGAGLAALSIVPMYERAKPILQSPVETRGHSDVRIDLDGGIELSHVSFRYQPDSPLVLDDLNLRIEPGEFVAVVGPSGSGKSTLLRILLGFEQPSAGGVFYDGQALAAMDVRAVRQQIGVVLQHSNVMAGDIHTNIVGHSGLTLEDAWRAAHQAAFATDIEAMPMGMHTVLSQGGGSLSGGQRQRLLIARALSSEPRILFFDEATSALDNQTQAAVSESLERLRVTRVVIAHRLSTIQHADRIIVIEAGRIVEEGAFEDLLEAGGTFAALANRQLV